MDDFDDLFGMRRRPTPSHFDTAQICLNGHIITAMAAEHPERQKKFCDRCGEPTLMQCQSCQTAIRGYYHVYNVFTATGIPLPAYCHSCGKPYPWTERRVQAAIDLAAEEESLSAEDKKQFNQSVNEITRDTPQAQVGATRLKKLLAKFGAGTGKAVRDIVVDIASEAVKKTIWPGT
jgi:hypothetical protein